MVRPPIFKIKLPVLFLKYNFAVKLKTSRMCLLKTKYKVKMKKKGQK